MTSKRQPAHVVAVWWSKWHWIIDVDTVDEALSGLIATKKSLVVAAARGIARELKAELVIKDKRGRIQKRDSHGNDPRRRPG